MKPKRLAKPVAMNAGGRLTLPAEVPREYAWAYTPEYRDLVRRSRENYAAGRTRQLSPADFEKLLEESG